MNMHHLSYAITVNASTARIWEVLTDSHLYSMWAKAFSDASRFEGHWRAGNTIRFVDPTIGGTVAVIDDLVQNRHILLRHVGLVDKAGGVSTQGEMADKWIGSTEEYQLVEKTDASDNPVVTLLIEVNTHEDFVDMFNQCWPAALESVRDISEERHC